MSFGGLTFLAPLTLLGLLLLPLVWWILKISPPAPKRQAFPAISVVDELTTDEETPQGTPLWLLLFRLLMVALAIVALSRPIITPDEISADRPVTIILDDSALSAPVWRDLTDQARARLREARSRNQDAIFLTSEWPAIDTVPAEEALRRLEGAQPRSDTEMFEIGSLPSERETVFLSSGAIDNRKDAWLTSLRNANATVLTPTPQAPHILPGDVRETSTGFESDWLAINGGQTASIEALAENGTVLAIESVVFPPGRTLQTVRMSLPPQLRQRVARLRVAGQRAAVSTKLLDDRFGRPLIGILAPPSGTSSPLLSEEFYAQQALAPFADVFVGDQDTVLSLNPSLLVMPDIVGSDAQDIIDYVEGGGLLIRFAGPRLASSPDGLVPVELRQGGRSIGGALAWETPQRLSNFDGDSPFAGLTIPDDVTVSTQVMARPGAMTDARTWARLEDGSPVVTSATQGDGRVVLFHVTAGPEWSNLSISGLYVDMLKRILPLARQRTATTTDGSGDWILDRALGPFGDLRPPPPETITLTEPQILTPQASAIAGYYRRGTERRAINAISQPDAIQPLPRNGLNFALIEGSEAQTLGGLLLAIALAMLAIDVLFSAFTSGRGRRLIPFGATTLFLFILTPDSGFAQDNRVGEAALGLHLAYVETGNASTDSLSQTAMESLSQQLTLRTTIEPVGVHGVEPGNEGLELYPFLYWPIRFDTPALTDEERASINGYLASGGTLVLDTADEGERSLRAGAPHPGLTRVTDGLNIGRLVPVPGDHVLTKSFYLMQVFPGRWANGPVYVEAADSTATGRDGVSSVIIGSHDWAAGWAIDREIGSLIELSNDIPRQREMSIRFGVNLAMYALAGNYKADQVHAAELIRRLGGPNLDAGTSMDEIRDAEEPR